mmetsp:Transcript_109103/g.188990  ORF Transcript_109103/g.188990 Transcript_109103/m.188990 type:complete len:372 (-) Transcript_109103:806-1921(-)
MQPPSLVPGRVPQPAAAPTSLVRSADAPSPHPSPSAVQPASAQGSPPLSQQAPAAVVLPAPWPEPGAAAAQPRPLQLSASAAGSSAPCPPLWRPSHPAVPATDGRHRLADGGAAPPAPPRGGDGTSPPWTSQPLERRFGPDFQPADAPWSPAPPAPPVISLPGAESLLGHHGLTAVAVAHRARITRLQADCVPHRLHFLHPAGPAASSSPLPVANGYPLGGASALPSAAPLRQTSVPPSPFVPAVPALAPVRIGVLPSPQALQPRGSPAGPPPLPPKQLLPSGTGDGPACVSQRLCLRACGPTSPASGAESPAPPALTPHSPGHAPPPSPGLTGSATSSGSSWLPAPNTASASCMPPPSGPSIHDTSTAVA